MEVPLHFLYNCCTNSTIVKMMRYEKKRININLGFVQAEEVRGGATEQQSCEIRHYNTR